jgi:hypothetical protein
VWDWKNSSSPQMQEKGEGAILERRKHLLDDAEKEELRWAKDELQRARDALRRAIRVLRTLLE